MHWHAPELCLSGKQTFNSSLYNSPVRAIIVGTEKAGTHLMAPAMCPYTQLQCLCCSGHTRLLSGAIGPGMVAGTHCQAGSGACPSQCWAPAWEAGNMWSLGGRCRVGSALCGLPGAAEPRASNTLSQGRLGRACSSAQYPAAAMCTSWTPWALTGWHRSLSVLASISQTWWPSGRQDQQRH